MKYLLGIDIGSAAAKAVLTEDGRTVYTAYERHYSRARDTLLDMVSAVREPFGDLPLYVAVDYDAGASKVNQENRLRLMPANARFEAYENA